MASVTRRRSRESDESEEERESKRVHTSEEESSSVGATESDEEVKGGKPENVVTHRCRICHLAMTTTREKAQNHTRYCSSKAKQKNLKNREKTGHSGKTKRKGKKGRQSRRYE